MTPENKSEMNVSKPRFGRDSYLPEIQKKLLEGASQRDLLNLVCLEMTSILEEHRQLMEASSPSRFHRRNKALRQHAKCLMTRHRGVRMLARVIESLPDRDNTDWEGKLNEIVDTIAEVAVDCLKRTVPNQQLIVETWAGLFFQELEERKKDIFRAIDK